MKSFCFLFTPEKFLKKHMTSSKEHVSEGKQMRQGNKGEGR